MMMLDHGHLEKVMTKKDPYAHAPRLPEQETISFFEIMPCEVRHPIWEIEIGSGRGGFLFERAAVLPNAVLCGLEIRRKWATFVDLRLKKAGLHPRVRCFAEDAKFALPRIRPHHFVDRIYLHFPDPWWKKRHVKRMMVGDVFLREVSRLLKVGGELFIQTDVEERIGMYETRVAMFSEFVPAGDAPGSARLIDNPYVARSPREHRSIRDGLPIYRLRYRREETPVTEDGWTE